MHIKKRYLKQPLSADSPLFALVRAEVAELVDALGSGSSRRFPVGVRVSPSAPNIYVSYR